MNDNIPTVTIDMNKKCAECGKGGAAQNGLCLECTADAMLGRKPMKSLIGRAVAARSAELRAKRTPR